MVKIQDSDPADLVRTDSARDGESPAGEAPPARSPSIPRRPRTVTPEEQRMIAGDLLPGGEASGGRIDPVEERPASAARPRTFWSFGGSPDAAGDSRRVDRRWIGR